MSARAPKPRVSRVCLPRSRPLAGIGLGLLAAVACTDFNTNRVTSPEGTLGEEMFGLVCDRLGGQSLHEDLSGASFHDICHRDADGNFADQVDQSLLPPVDSDRPDINGDIVAAADQQTQRAIDVARVETLARHRADLIAAFDAAFPDIQVPVVDDTCAPAGQDSLHTQLQYLLGRMGDLYNDRTVPQATESLAAVVDAFNGSADAKAAWARMNARGGYRFIDAALGVARPAIAYPKLRDLTNSTLKLLSADSDPYTLTPQFDDNGARVPVPGAAYAQLSHLLDVSHAEMVSATVDATTSLSAPVDPQIPRAVLSRPRTDLEFLQALASAVDPTFGTASPKYIVKRDVRGYAAVPLVGGALPSIFQRDAHDPTLPAIDSLGQFVTTNGQPAPAPFFAIGSPDAVARDQAGRALLAKGGAPLYATLDVNHTFLADLLSHLKPLVNPDPAQTHETLMDEIAGAYVLLGTRDGAPNSSYKYPDGTVIKFNAFHANASPLADFVYALGQILADPSTDATLGLFGNLMAQHPNDVARLAGDALYGRNLAVQDTTAKIPPTSTLWDEILDVVAKIAQEPGLLEDILRATGNDATIGLGKSLASSMTNRDVMSYDRNNLNGPVVDTTTPGSTTPSTPVDRTKPDTGNNRSELQRFAQIIHDTNGAAMCNKEGAVLHAQGILGVLQGDVCGSTSAGAGNSGALCGFDTNCNSTCANSRPFHECEVFKIDNLASFYLDAIVGKARLYYRPALIRNGLCFGNAAPPCTGVTTAGLTEQSSGIGNDNDGGVPGDTYNGGTDPSKPGFWDLADASSYSDPDGGVGLHPKPGWIDRQIGFDQTNDSPDGGVNHLTNHFLTDLQGMQVGTTVCPERVIPDPCKGDTQCGSSDAVAGVSPDGMVHGLRSCADGDWLNQRDGDVLFYNEANGFFTAITPLASAFVNHGREDLFLALMEALNKHWQSSAGTAAECKLGTDAQGHPVTCSKDGADSYEPLLSKILSTDMLAALNNLSKILQSTSLPTCGAVDSTTHLCTQVTTKDGVSILADATRALVDPTRAASFHLVDARGAVTAQRNDGTTNPQVTPLYLMLEALNEIDSSFAAYAKANPNDAGRQAQWQRARSQLVDELLKINGENTTTQSFGDPALPKIAPVLLDTLRAQILANCGSTPAGQCTWARQQFYKEFVDVIQTRPLFSAIVDLNEAIRQDTNARTQMESLLQYLLSDPNAVQDILTSGNDLLQVLGDDTNLVPLYHVLATATQATTDGNGNTIRSVIDATTALLSRTAGRAYDDSNNEACGQELDPNTVLNLALAHLVQPMKDSSGNALQTPLEYIIDAIADVNRLQPGATSATTGGGTLPKKLEDKDYANITDQLSQFLLDDQRGLEQLYEVVRQGTSH
jgi:hypothetical protein